MVFCHHCKKVTDQLYTCGHCKYKLKEAREVTIQFTGGYKCEYPKCGKAFKFKELAWNVNYSYFHKDCFELKKKEITAPAPTGPIGTPIGKQISGGKKKRKGFFDLFVRDTESNELKPEQQDIMDSVSAIDWPTIAQIDESVSNLKKTSNEDEIKHLQVVKDWMGCPTTFPGQFAIVYQMQNSKEKNKNEALRFFSKKKKGSMHRYRILQEYLEPYSEKDLLNFFIHFNFIKDAVNIKGKKETISVPVIKMDWIEGNTLEKFLRIDPNKRKIEKVKINFKKMIDEMDRQEIAHGDLHPKNMIITKNSEIKLVDYDCLFIKPFSGDKMPEAGDPDCQHPNRVNFKYDHTIDRFSAFVLYFALSILEDNPEFFKIRNGEFIFSREDYENPEQSETFKKISKLPSPEIQYFLKVLKDICKQKKPSIDPLSSIVENIPSTKEDNDKK